MGINDNPFNQIFKLGVIVSGGDPEGDGDHPKDESRSEERRDGKECGNRWETNLENTEVVDETRRVERREY